MRTAFLALLAIAAATPAMADEPAAAPQPAAAQPPMAQPAVAQPAPMATLKAAIRVAGKMITLGDLFDNAGSRAGDEVAASPAPGASMVLDASWLALTARSHGILWQAPNIFTTIRVERAATVIETADIEKALAAATGFDRPDRHIALDTRTRLYAPVGDTPHLDIEHIEYEQETNRIKAEVKVAGDDPALRTLTVYGRVETLIELPVLSHVVMPGEVIEPADLTSTWLRADLTPAGAVTDVQALIGKTPRRPLRPGQAFRPLDVEVPLVIKRNDLVLIVLERPGMYLTAEGKALEDGGRGSVIKVMNVQSNRSIDAVVDATGRVSVHLAGQQQAAAY